MRRLSPGDLLLGNDQRSVTAQEPDPHPQGPDRAAAHLRNALVEGTPPFPPRRLVLPPKLDWIYSRGVVLFCPCRVVADGYDRVGM